VLGIISPRIFTGIQGKMGWSYQRECMFDKTDKPTGRSLDCLLTIWRHIKVRRYCTLDLLVDHSASLPWSKHFYRAWECNMEFKLFFRCHLLVKSTTLLLHSFHIVFWDRKTKQEKTDVYRKNTVYIFSWSHIYQFFPFNLLWRKPSPWEIVGTCECYRQSFC
jgi:hypothetical protein